MINEIKSIPGLKIISKKPAFVKSFPLLTQKSHFRKIYEQFKPDIVHTGYVWQVGVLASHYNIHPHLSMVWGSDVLFEPDNNPYIKRLVKQVMLRSDHIQCDAEFVKEKIRRDYFVDESKITVFPWGIDLDLFKKHNKIESRAQTGLPTDKFILIFNRSLESVYGISDLLEGFKRFSENKDDVMLMMLASGSKKEFVMRYIQKNNLSAKVRLMDRIANSLLPAYLNSSDVYISTALSDGTSLAMLEALACGLPVIAADVPAIREWISETNGIIIPKKSPEKVCDALEKYYNNRKLMEEHGIINMRIAEERADWDINYLKLKEIYNKMLD